MGARFLEVAADTVGSSTHMTGRQMTKRIALPAVAVVLALLVAVPAAAAPVKTRAVIEKMTRTSLPGDDAWSAKGRVTAKDEACLSKREVVIIQELGPPFNNPSVMNVVETDSKGRWKAKWTTRAGPNDIEQASTGVHYITVEMLKKGKRKCSFARSKTYTVPAP